VGKGESNAIPGTVKTLTREVVFSWEKSLQEMSDRSGHSSVDKRSLPGKAGDLTVEVTGTLLLVKEVKAK